MSKKDDKYWGPLSNKSYWLKRSEELDKVAKMTEKEVMKAIEGLQGTKTMLMIAHRLTTIENCDLIYKVENGIDLFTKSFIASVKRTSPLL